MNSSTIIERGWGHEEVIHNGDYCVKQLHVRAGFQSSLHYHPVKDETFVALSGEGMLEIHNGPQIEFVSLVPGIWRRIPSNTPHRFWSKRGCVIVESSTHHDDADVVRVEPSQAMNGRDPKMLREAHLANA